MTDDSGLKEGNPFSFIVIPIAIYQNDKKHFRTVGRMEREGILEMDGFYDKTDNNKLRMTVGYRLSANSGIINFTSGQVNSYNM